MRNLDKEVKDAIAHLESMHEQEVENLVNDIDTIRTAFPDEMLLQVAVDVAKEQMKDNDEHINMHRQKYNAIKSFKEKKEYYEKTLRLRELGYQVVTEKLNKFLADPKVKPYELWVRPHTLTEMKRKGYKAVIRDELLYGHLT